MKKVFAFLFVLTFSLTRLYATTWDEPWTNKVIKDASSFVLAKITSAEEGKDIHIKIVKTLAGKEIKDSAVIFGFYDLQLCSSSGHGAEFHLSEADSCYFFLKEVNGKYQIATPTSGFAYAQEGQVVATYRHSYHQAQVPVTVYEKTMTAIFNNYHALTYDKDYIITFVNQQLTKKPAGFEDDQIKRFFLQHAAMETAYHLKLDIDEKLLLPFLNDTLNSHNRISAARALSAFNTTSSKQALLSVIRDAPTEADFLKVICIWSLKENKPRELKNDLIALEKNASEESNSFGGNIMDPRVCTSIPSVKDALKELITQL